MAEIVGQVDDGHAAASELTLDAVVIGKRRLEATLGRRHTAATAMDLSKPILSISRAKPALDLKGSSLGST